MLTVSWLFESGFLFKTLFAVFSFIIALQDVKTGMVPRIAFFFAFPFFCALRLLQARPQSPVSIFGGALLGFLIFVSAYLISRKKLGLADVWYSALVGLALGPWRWYAAMSCACLTGIICMFVLKRRQIPFIPLMAVGGIIMIMII